MSEALQLTSQCNKSFFAVLNQPQLVYIYVEMLPGTALSNVRMPLNFALVLDHSGSMAGDKLNTMKAAVKNIIDQLEPSDIVSIITFGDKTTTIIPAQPAQDKNGIKRKVDGISDDGGTTMAPGLREGLAQVSRNNTPDRISRIVLLTDGEATDNEDDSRREAENSGARGIPIIGLGFGQDWKKEEFMFDLADRSIFAPPGSRSGKVEYIKDPANAISVFEEVLQAMQIVAQNVQLTLRMVQGIEARRVWQVVPMIKDVGLQTIQGRSIVVPVGELEKGGASYLIEMMVPPRPAGNVRIAQTEVSFDVPRQGSQREAVDMIVNFATDPGLLAQPANGKVMNIVEKVTAFKLQTQALDEAQLGNVQGATQKLRQAVTILLNQGDTQLANQMQQELTNLESGKGISAEGKKTIKLTSRKTVKLSD
jgi:Ca-activated chloride channel family protein